MYPHQLHYLVIGLNDILSCMILSKIFANIIFMSYLRTQIKKLVENSIAMAEQAAEYYNRECRKG